MSRATPDDQLKFLLNCVKHSNNGKIDFVEVAKECGIVSKGAAAKRYERLLKANGIHPNGGPSEKPTAPDAPREKSKAPIVKAAASKKRKLERAATSVKVDGSDNKMLTKPKKELDGPQHIKPEPFSNEAKTAPTFKSPLSPKVMSPLPLSAQLSPPPQSQQLFNLPHMAYPHARHYRPHMGHMLHYPGPLMPLPPPPPSPMKQYQYSIQQSSILPRHIPNLDDRSMFEDFCTPELFEQRTFLEMPHVEQAATIPPPPQEVTMKDLHIQETVEANSNEPRSGKRPSESILILD